MHTDIGVENPLAILRLVSFNQIVSSLFFIYWCTFKVKKRKCTNFFLLFWARGLYDCFSNSGKKIKLLTWICMLTQSRLNRRCWSCLCWGPPVSSGPLYRCGSNPCHVHTPACPAAEDQSWGRSPTETVSPHSRNAFPDQCRVYQWQ